MILIMISSTELLIQKVLILKKFFIKEFQIRYGRFLRVYPSASDTQKPYNNGTMAIGYPHGNYSRW